jgi:hypothetical protein
MRLNVALMTAMTITWRLMALQVAERATLMWTSAPAILARTGHNAWIQLPRWQCLRTLISAAVLQALPKVSAHIYSSLNTRKTARCFTAASLVMEAIVMSMSMSV